MSFNSSFRGLLILLRNFGMSRGFESDLCHLYYDLRKWSAMSGFCQACGNRKRPRWSGAALKKELITLVTVRIIQLMILHVVSLYVVPSLIYLSSRFIRVLNSNTGRVSQFWWRRKAAYSKEIPFYHPIYPPSTIFSERITRCVLVLVELQW